MTSFRMALRVAILVPLAAAALLGAPARAAPPCESRACPSTWLNVDADGRRDVFALADDYKAFMGQARSAPTTVAEARRRAEAAGFREWRPGQRMATGSRWYQNNRGQALTLWVVGSEPIAGGVRISASHIDSVHLELKARPLYEAEGFALFQTQVHGGLLTYEWGNTPLALVGRVDRKDGSHVDVSIGLKPSDPVFMVAQLSPHVDADLRNRTQREVLAAEELDPIVGALPLGADGSVRAQVAQALKSEYGIGIDDFVSAQLALVPAMQPRDLGFDRSLMAMYGQDDRFAAYASLRALFDLKTPRKTAVVALFDNEEVGDVNNVGAASDNLVNLLRDLLAAEKGESYREPQFTAMLRASKAVSTDVNDAVNPIWPSAWEGGNAPRVGQGVNIKVYGQGNNAPGAYMAWLRRTLDEAGVPWQTATYKVGRASGGTLGGDLSRHDLDVVDLGAPVLSIHHTYDISSKIDLWWLRKANAAFFAAAD